MTPTAETTVREPVLPDTVVCIEIEPSMRLADMIAVEQTMRLAMKTGAIRIVLDARRLASMTRGAHLALVDATIRLERAGVELVLKR